MPGSGDDMTPLGEVGMASYVDRIRATVTEIGEPVTLVAHSMGGLSSTVAASETPEQVAALIYVAALVPNDGETALSILGALPPGGLSSRLKPTRDGLAFHLERSDSIDHFYKDCDEVIAADAASRLSPQPSGPMTDTVRVAPSIGLVSSGYVLTRDDRTLPVAQQRQFSVRRSMETIEIDGGHSPFLSDPGGFADVLLALEMRL
ncbi:hypothetical protein ASD81_16620 [Nocardioides sp. Root614]|nr:hypothetical protein ASD81_16620 [Nocardioides sp. Root614]KRA87726.1 hypothetical protein ASD84_16890 [Nocardioides sp. Root682]